MNSIRLSILLIVAAALHGGEDSASKTTPPPPVPTPPPPAATPADAEEPYKKLTRKEIDAITYEDCDDDEGVTFPFLASFERATSGGEDRKKSFEEWKEKVEAWDCNDEKKIGQRVRNYISLMALVDILQMEFEGETPLILFEKMKREIPKEELIKAAAYCALKPEEGKVIDKAPSLGIDDGAAEDRVRERVSVYAKKVLGRLLGKLPPKPEEPEKPAAK